MCTHILLSMKAHKFEAVCNLTHFHLYRSTEIRCQNPAITNCAFQFSVVFLLISSPIFPTASLICLHTRFMFCMHKEEFFDFHTKRFLSWKQGSCILRDFVSLPTIKFFFAVGPETSYVFFCDFSNSFRLKLRPLMML